MVVRMKYVFRQISVNFIQLILTFSQKTHPMKVTFKVQNMQTFRKKKLDN